MDMTKAFDTTKYKILLKDFRHIVETDEQYVYKLLTKDVHLLLKVEGETSEAFTTKQSIGLFILYLPKSLGLKPHLINRIQSEPMPKDLKEHDYQMNEEKIMKCYGQNII